MPHKILNPPNFPACIVPIISAANTITLIISSAVVTGACPPKNSLSPLLHAARPNRKFVPHTWQRVALIPTNDPHAGHSCGLRSPRPNIPPNILFKRSTRICQ